MQLLYLIPGEGMPDDEIARREKVVNALARKGTQITIEEVGEGPISIESSIEEHMSIGPMLKRLYHLRKDGKYDAIIIGCAGDPGLRPARELMDIPVIGPAEAAFHYACMISDRFSVISTLQAGVDSADDLVERLRGMGLWSRFTSVEFVEIPIVQMWNDDPNPVVKQIKPAIEKARLKGAGCIVLGCMSMAFRTVFTDWENAGIPIVNPLHVAIKTAESMVDLGLIQSRISYPAADLTKLVETVFKE